MNRKFVLLAGLLAAAHLAAAFQTDPVFSSNMVLQQEKPIAFFGTGDRGTTIRAEFAGKRAVATVTPEGTWRVEFPAMKAGKEAFEAKFEDGKKQIVFKNLLIGDVWFCSGQSNMSLTVGRKFIFGSTAKNSEQETAAANYPLIRSAKQVQCVSHGALLPARMAEKTWTVCSPATAGTYSAVGYYFARELYKSRGIPIGIICAAWGGTRIEGWISREGYEAADLTKELGRINKYTMTPAQEKEAVARSEKRYGEEMPAFLKKMESLRAAEKASCAGYAKADFDDSAWKPASLRGIKGAEIRWFRSRFTLPESARGKKLRLYSSNVPIARGFTVWLNGKEIRTVGAGALDPELKLNLMLPSDAFAQTGENVLAIRAFYCYPRDLQRVNDLRRYICLYDGRQKSLTLKWKDLTESTLPAGKNGPVLPENHVLPFMNNQFPCNLYNAMVDSWTKLPIKGIIWYQGCANAGDLHYLPQHRALIADWRAKWRNPELPFLVVQLSAWGDVNWMKRPPREVRAALTRDIQMQLLDIDRVGVICTIDIGDPVTIHPPDKQTVGYRLSLEARRMVYGEKIASQGPLFDRAQVEGSKIRVFFKNVTAPLKTKDGKKPGAFAIAGADKKFVWADAEIDGKTVVVSSKKIKEPKFVRYAYIQYRGDCNLQSADGLPAYPFRSDAVDYSQVK